LKYSSAQTEITLSQTTYAKEVVARFRQEACKQVKTPISEIYVETKEDEMITSDEYPIREAIGCLTYIANGTRPDLSVAINNVARFLTRPRKRLWKATQKIIKYLAATTELGLHISSGSNLTIQGYADADYAGDPLDRRSTTGWIFFIGSSPVSWKTAKQKAVTLSTTEAEYTAAADAAKEAIWLRDLFEELEVSKGVSPIIHQENQCAVFLEKNHSLKQRTKHIDIKVHYIRERVREGDITIHYCNTEDMIADIFTKPLNKSRFIKHRKSILNMKDQDRVNSEEECQQ
jgi:hypothetical protein